MLLHQEMMLFAIDDDAYLLHSLYKSLKFKETN